MIQRHTILQCQFSRSNSSGKSNFKRRIRDYLLVLFGCMYAAVFYCQDSIRKPLTLEAYGELYYSYDFSKPSSGEKPIFVSNHKRSNELSANLIYFKTNYRQQDYRANFGLMLGDYAEYNLVSEPVWAKFIYEANVGLKISEKHNLWLDIGIMPSHLGFESVVGAECWTLTRSMLAEGSPYYEAGAKLSFTDKKERFTASFHLLNGWQRIRKLRGYSDLPSLGFQFQYRPRKGLLVNYSNFIGDAQPENMHGWRQFHNFYLQYESQHKWDLILGFDLGMDKYTIIDEGFWYSTVAILRYKWTSKWTSALRLEYFSDEHGIIFPTQTLNGFQTFGVSFNQDYQFNSYVKFRLEYKYLQSKDAIYNYNDVRNHAFTSSCIFLLKK